MYKYPTFYHFKTWFGSYQVSTDFFTNPQTLKKKDKDQESSLVSTSLYAYMQVYMCSVLYLVSASKKFKICCVIPRRIHPTFVHGSLGSHLVTTKSTLNPERIISEPENARN